MKGHEVFREGRRIGCTGGGGRAGGATSRGTFMHLAVYENHGDLTFHAYDRRGGHDYDLRVSFAEVPVPRHCSALHCTAPHLAMQWYWYWYWLW